ncbi:hypothetical protein MiTa_01517 [Microcystis aeruginosa NIES-4264]|nr:hypothetical protein MiTa_01517 [Microcystis aeruginosa NIES-4264]
MNYQLLEDIESELKWQQSLSALLVSVWKRGLY